jgi:hypothetical protein
MTCPGQVENFNILTPLQENLDNTYWITHCHASAVIFELILPKNKVDTVLSSHWIECRTGLLDINLKWDLPSQVWLTCIGSVVSKKIFMWKSKDGCQYTFL